MRLITPQLLVDACATKQAIIEVEILFFLFSANSVHEGEPWPPKRRDLVNRLVGFVVDFNHRSLQPWPSTVGGGATLEMRMGGISTSLHPFKKLPGVSDQEK